MMTARLSTAAARSTIVVGALLTLALLSSSRASTQGTSATDQQLSALKQQVTALDRRVKDLEKTAISVPDGDKPDAATLAGRIAQLESQVRSLQSHEAVTGGRSASSKVFAPFIVVDHAGKELARITEGGEPASNGLPLSRGLYVFDGRAQVASHVGAMPDGGGRIYAARNGALPVAAMAATENGGRIQVGGPGTDAAELSVGPTGGVVQVFPPQGGSAQAQLAATPAGGELRVYNVKGEAVSWLEATTAGNARFVIGRAGNVFVEAGVLEKGIGIVLTGPQSGGAPAGLVTPNMLMGRKQ